MLPVPPAGHAGTASGQDTVIPGSQIQMRHGLNLVNIIMNDGAADQMVAGTGQPFNQCITGFVVSFGTAVRDRPTAADRLNSILSLVAVISLSSVVLQGWDAQRLVSGQAVLRLIDASVRDWPAPAAIEAVPHHLCRAASGRSSNSSVRLDIETCFPRRQTFQQHQGITTMIDLAHPFIEVPGPPNGKQTTRSQ